MAKSAEPLNKKKLENRFSFPSLHDGRILDEI